jgi:fructose-1,6-bisphosphatase/inositol monophosphatase family enzyme
VDDVSLAAELARDAGQLAASMLADGLETEYKSSISDVVSAADHAAEEMITARLAEHRADDAIVGEEGARSPGKDRTWYVDPVDGTYNFLSGLPYWCSAIGLADAEGPLVGAVYFPPRDELWVGGRDEPTTLNGVPLAELADRPLAELCDEVIERLRPEGLQDDVALVAIRLHREDRPRPREAGPEKLPPRFG